MKSFFDEDLSIEDRRLGKMNMSNQARILRLEDLVEELHHELLKLKVTPIVSKASGLRGKSVKASSRA